MVRNETFTLTEKIRSCDTKWASNIQIGNKTSSSKADISAILKPAYVAHHHVGCGGDFYGLKKNFLNDSKTLPNDTVEIQDNSYLVKRQMVDHLDQVAAKINGSVHAMRIYVERRLNEQQKEVMAKFSSVETSNTKSQIHKVNSGSEHPMIESSLIKDYFSSLEKKMCSLIEDKIASLESKLEDFISNKMNEISLSHNNRLSEIFEEINSKFKDSNVNIRSLQEFSEKSNFEIAHKQQLD